MRGGYQILDLSILTVGTEGVVKNSFNTISNHNNKVVMVKTPDGNDVFAKFSKSGDDYIGAYMGSDGKCYSVVINSDNECTITDEGETGADDYTELSHKPQINSVELTGNKSLSDLGISDAISTAITTALTPQTFALSDVMENVQLIYQIRKKVGNVAYLSMSIYNMPSGSPTSSVPYKLFTLPESVRSSQQVRCEVILGNTSLDISSGNGIIVVQSNGDVEFYTLDEKSVEGSTFIAFNTSWVIG